MSTADQPKLSPVEGFKNESHFLRGTIPEELADPNVDHLGKSSEALLKHHGTYQQDDRDYRAAHKKEGTYQYVFMVRTKIPGGKLTAPQMLAEIDLCDELGNATLRITSRQGLQHHGVAKKNLKRVIARINEVQLSTLGACGDVNRNVMCCPAPLKQNTLRAEMQALAEKLAAHFAPRTTAYHDIWLTNTSTGVQEKVPSADGYDVEPIYGRHYLPRKFKMAIGLPEDNCVDIYTNDLGFLTVHREGRILGYNLLPGGGQGVTPAAKKTFAALGKRLCFVTPDQAVPVAEAIVKVQRDYGNREDRKLARLKYLIHNWGLEKFKAKVEEYYGAKLPDCEPDEVFGFDDHMGWHDQGDGRWFYGLNVENGRIKDTDKMQLKMAVREVCRQLNPGIRLTSHQSILFTDVAPGERENLEQILRKYSVPLTEQISTVRRWSMACVAWPTCGLSITESERALPGIIDHVEADLAKLGLASEKFTIRMTGCPNGCARPYNCDIGLVGKTLGKYTILVGGRLLGTRLNFVYKDLVPEANVASELTPLFVYFKQAREAGESFGDFCQRKGQADLLAFATQFAAAAAG